MPASLAPTDLIRCLEGIGVRPGDTLLVHSSLRALGPFDGGGEALIDTLVGALGPDGLLVVPTHTWSIVNDRQPVWHEILTPSHVGTLTNLLRNRPGAVRSLHPTHSVAALGPRAQEFCAGHEHDDSPCSPTSPYGRLLEADGQILMLGVDLTRCTFIHCLEEIAGLGPIWSLTGSARRYCIRADGTVIPVTARTHQDYKSDNYGRAEAELIAAGIVTVTQLGPARLLFIDARRLADFLVPRFQKDPKYFW